MRAPRPGIARLIAHDDFRHGLGQWFVELEQAGTVAASHGILEVDVPAGATVWRGRTSWSTPPHRCRRAAPTTESLTSTTSGTPPTSVPLTTSSSIPRGGVLAEYDYLKTYYAGYGADYSTTTGLRRYVGEPGVRPLVHDHTEPLLVANRPNRVRIVSDGAAVQWWNNGRPVFHHTDLEPLHAWVLRLPCHLESLQVQRLRRLAIITSTSLVRALFQPW